MITLLLKTISEKHKASDAFNRFITRCDSRNYHIALSGPKGFYRAILMNEIMNRGRSRLLIVLPSEQDVQECALDLRHFNTPVSIFPGWNVIPYSGAEPQPNIFTERLKTLQILSSGSRCVVLTTLRTFLFPVPPREFIHQSKKTVRIGNEIHPQEIESWLAFAGYIKVPKVSIVGEFALRGEVLDIFLPTRDEPVRIVFEYEEIEDIKYFNPSSQSSTERIDTIDLVPLGEILWTDERLAALKHNLGEKGDNPILTPEVLESLDTAGKCIHQELLFPLSFEGLYSLTDYVDKNSVLFLPEYERLYNAAAVLKKECLDLYKNNREKTPVPVPPDRYLLDIGHIERSFSRVITIRVLAAEREQEDHVLDIPCGEPRSFFGNLSYLKEELTNLEKAGYTVFICADSESQKNRIEFLLKDLDVAVLDVPISSGFSLPESKIIVIQENEIFGRRRRIPASVTRAKTKAIETFVELNPGDYVVHINYGIGKFIRIGRIKAAGTERDYIELRYAEEETIFIPIEQVNLIQRYIGSEGSSPRLDKLGGKSWEKRKYLVKKSVEDLAQRLIHLYSKRKQVQGFAFPADNDWQVEFEAGFPFEETRDQLTCIREVKDDMETPRPMDRLVCGDVGYGNTEIAMRAAFKSVMGGKQVGVLAPTTILVEQHYENFLERFKRFPFNIAMISRFLSKSEQKKVIAGVKNGDVDILIGTHRLLQKDLHFKNLGLIVVDEEQRFGVKDKERLKELKSSVDSLTLSATPIPRTLHMSLLKIRDMSLLSTPPQNRLPIETHVGEFDEEMITEAVRQEMDRGGQVFFLHNRIETLHNVQKFIQTIIPEAVVEVAHGQMRSQDLEEVMHQFVHGAFHVLVSTTIIENGIDIPNVNTIIIDRADLYGISQLYQLRGRVGRSDRPAYAYLLYPKDKALTELAMKRLKIISDNTALGSGFKVALKDLEVRGAGNLLGREQHGDILAVGFDMYLRLLDETISEMTSDDHEEPPEVYLELDYSGFIPNSYIHEPEEKMEVYKKIASISEDQDLDRITFELEDRFGPLPDEVQSLIALAEIRTMCKKLWISSLKERNGSAHVEFFKVSRVSVDKLLRLIRDSGNKVRLDPKKPNIIVMKTDVVGLKEKSEYIREKLSFLL